MPLSLPILEYTAVWGGPGSVPLSHLQEKAHCVWLEEGITLAPKYFCYKAAIAHRICHCILAHKRKGKYIIK